MPREVVDVAEFRSLLDANDELERKVKELREKLEDEQAETRKLPALRQALARAESRLDIERGDKLALRAQAGKQDTLIAALRSELAARVEQIEEQNATLRKHHDNADELERALRAETRLRDIVAAKDAELDELRREVERLQPHEAQTRALNEALDQARRL